MLLYTYSSAYPGQTYSGNSSQFYDTEYAYSTPPAPQIPRSDNRRMPSTEVDNSTTKVFYNVSILM